MGTVTGLTAEAMQAIIEGQIVGATIVSNHLILERNDGSTLDAGDVGTGAQVAAHAADETDVHGIPDTSKLVRTAGTDGESDLRVIRGAFNGAGAVTKPSVNPPFSVTRSAVGTYAVTFDTPFTGEDPVIIVGMGPTNNNGRCVRPTSRSLTGFGVRVDSSSTGTAQDEPVDFIVIGPV